MTLCFRVYGRVYHFWEGQLVVFCLTIVFSRSSGVGFDSLEDDAGVANDLPDELHEDGGQEPENPVADVVSAPDEVEEEAQDEDDEGVGIKHVLGAPGPIPLLDKQRPPGSLVPSHDYMWSGVRVRGIKTENK